MNCAWCGANADGSDSHGICADCEALLLQQLAERHKRREQQQDQGQGQQGQQP
jgi:hypothetical protein